MQGWAIAAVSGLAIVALVILRITSGRPFRPLWNDLPDVVVALILWLSLALLTQRPASSALLWVVLAAGLLLADHTKIGVESLVKIAPIESIHRLITDVGISAHDRQALAQQGIEVIIAN